MIIHAFCEMLHDFYRNKDIVHSQHVVSLESTIYISNQYL